MNPRILAMMIKELLAVLRDPRARITLIAPPLLQLILFSAAATLEVKNISVGVFDRDGGVASAEFVNQLAGSPNVRSIVRLDSPTALREAIDDQKVIAAIIFNESFSRDVASGRGGQAQVILDGRRSNAAQIVAGYLDRVAASTGAALRHEASVTSAGQSIAVNWFNPNLDYLWFVMPALVVTICGVSALSVTVQSVARERELGTFDQLMVSPLRLHEILIGKMTPPVLIGLFNATLYLIVIPLIYGVPFRGSILLFYLSTFVFLCALVGVGMVVSSIAHTQQQAFLGMFLVTVPLTLLSGFAAPVDNMPGWLQLIAEADPQKHFLVITEGLFLKAMSARDVLANTWPLVVIAAVTLTAATIQFRSRVE
jgi:ABC-2 type transport system permease protein